MKKFFWLIFFLIFWINQAFAGEIIYTDPVGSDMNYRPAIFWPTADKLTYRIHTNTQNATQFCLQNGGSYVSHAGTSVPLAQYLYFSSNWLLTNSTNILTTVVCDIPEPEIQTIIDTNPWINKEIFDQDTINAIYLIEVIILFFIFFIRFFDRILE